MKKFKVEMTILLDDEEENAEENLMQLESHADYLLDLDSWPEIARVYNVKVNGLTGE